MKPAPIFVAAVIAAQLGCVGLADEPSTEDEREMRAGGLRDPARFENTPLFPGRRMTDLKVPQASMRRFYDLAGLPAEGAMTLRRPFKQFHHSPQAIKKGAGRPPFGVDWEVWRLNLIREEISWTAQITARQLPAPWAAPGFNDKRGWGIDYNNNQSLSGWDQSLNGSEQLWIRDQPVNSGEGAVQLVHWKISRPGSRYFTPRIRLADLSTLAPWFYTHLPRHVLDRAAWFDARAVRSIAVYADPRKPTAPSMVELEGAFCVGAKAREKRFDSFFEPDKFNRVHLRCDERLAAVNTARPTRESDVVILDSPTGLYRVRFVNTRRLTPVEPSPQVPTSPLIAFSNDELVRAIRGGKRVTVETIPVETLLDGIQPASMYRVVRRNALKDRFVLEAANSGVTISVAFRSLELAAAQWFVRDSEAE